MKIPNLKDEIEKDENAVQKAEELKEQKEQEKRDKYNDHIRSCADYVKQSKFLKHIYDKIKSNVYQSLTKSIKMGFFYHTSYDRLTHLGYASPKVQGEINFICGAIVLETIDEIRNNFNCVVGQLYDDVFKELLEENDIEYKDIDTTWDCGFNVFQVDYERYLLFRRKVRICYELKRINIACTLDKAMELYGKFLGTTDRMEIEDIHLKARENMKRQDKLND